MPKAAFVVNPTGGRGASMKAWQAIEAAVPGAKAYFTTGPGGGTDQGRKAVGDGCDRVVAVGGDGTVNEVANALIGTGVAMGVVPVGTGNDYARTIGVPTDPVAAARFALEGPTKAVDVGAVAGHRHFVNIAGAGFDAEVMTRFNHPGPVARVLPVKARYYLSIARTFAAYKGVKAVVTLDGQATNVDNLLLIAVGCAQYYGAGMHMMPMADLADGLFDIVWGQDVRLAELNKLMSLIYKGEHIGHANVRCARAKTVTIESQPPTRFHLDGDVTGTVPVSMSCEPEKLLVVTDL